MKYLAEKIEKYLVSECSDEWHVKYEKNKITAYYTSEKRFEIVYDNDFEEWYFSGKHILVSIIHGISEIINNTNLKDF